MDEAGEKPISRKHIYEISRASKALARELEKSSVIAFYHSFPVSREQNKIS